MIRHQLRAGPAVILSGLAAIALSMSASGQVSAPSPAPLDGACWGREADPACAQFRGWAVRWVAAPDGAPRTAELREGLRLAEARRTAMAAMIQSSPAEALACAVPLAVRRQLPPSIANRLEERVDGLGDYEVLAVDPMPGGKIQRTMERRVVLGHTVYHASVYGRREGQTCKRGIPVHGIALDGWLALHESPVRWLEPGESPPPRARVVPVGPLPDQARHPFAMSGDSLLRAADPEDIRVFEQAQIQAESGPGPEVPQSSSWTLGTQDVLVIRVDFPDKPGEFVSAATVQTTMDNEVNPWYQASSYGQTALRTSVSASLYRMPNASTVYTKMPGYGGAYALFSDATTAASQDYTVANYARVIVTFPGSPFGWSGLASLGGSRTWKNGWDNTPFDGQVLIHELGHNYGVDHANLWNVTDGNPLSDGGTSQEYGDPFDIMGGSPSTFRGPTPFRGDLNPWFKTQLEWLRMDSVTTVETSGTYRIYRFDDANVDRVQHRMALRIPRVGFQDYWVGLRRSQLDVEQNRFLSNAVYVAWGYGERSIPSDLLDMRTPGSETPLDAPLPIGMALHDAPWLVTIIPLQEGGVAPHEWVDIQVVVSSSTSSTSTTSTSSTTTSTSSTSTTSTSTTSSTSTTAVPLSASVYPSGWWWMAWPFAYDFGAGCWYWFDASSPQWCIPVRPAGPWAQLGTCPLGNGWAWFSWPYAYQHNTGAWYYLNEADSAWLVSMRTGEWWPFGDDPALTTMRLIPAGSFTMGSDNSLDAERPAHTVSLGAYYIDRFEVTKALWDTVYTWATAHGYSEFRNSGSGKAGNHPVHSVSWEDSVKWCNARSEFEGRAPVYYLDPGFASPYRSGYEPAAVFAKWTARGYRLPTEAEWERAARGGKNGHRYAWHDTETISHSRANYFSVSAFVGIDVSPTRGYHPDYDEGELPFTSPVGSFAPNAFGLYDMTGNVREWCWDFYDGYSPGSAVDPHGPANASNRIKRGGAWNNHANESTVTARYWYDSGDTGAMNAGDNHIGLRTVLNPGR